MNKVIWHVVAVALILAAAYFSAAGPAGEDASYPVRPIKLIVPFNPGGGTDTFARIIQRAIVDNGLLDQPLVVINRPGGNSTIGGRYVKDARPDGYTLLIQHEAMLTGKASGQADFGRDDFEIVAGTGKSSMIILVMEDSPYTDLRSLMAQAKEKPGELQFGVNLNTPSHITGLMLEKASPGSRFRFVSPGGGADRFHALSGKHIEAGVFSLSEYQRFKVSGARAIAYLGEERQSGIPDIPTAREQGFDVVNANTFYWWFPKGTDREKSGVVAEALATAMESDFVRDRLKELEIEPLFLSGDDLAADLDTKQADVEGVELKSRVKLPNLKIFVLIINALLFAAMVYRHCRRPLDILERPSLSDTTLALREGLAWSVLGITVLYALSLSSGLLSFRIATFLFVSAAIGIMLKLEQLRQKWPYLLEVALLMSVGMHAVFTQIFTVDLP